jgi:transposase InsO family protein
MDRRLRRAPDAEWVFMYRLGLSRKRIAELVRVHPALVGYQSLYVQSRGALKRDLAACLRTGRAVRQPCRKAGQRKGGDLIIGKGNQSAIGTLVERTTSYTMLVHLPDGYRAKQMRDALAAKIKTLPEALRHSLTWDQGIEMQDWKTVKIDAGIDIYFCDPHSPWQRGINENTNGMLRQYFPKGTDLGIHSAADLDWVAQELNDRPRKRLAFRKPIELIEDLLLQ